MNEQQKNLSIVSQTAAKIAGHVIQSDEAIAAVRNGVMAEVHETILCAILDGANLTPAAAPAALASVTEHPAAQSNDEAVEKILEAIPGAATAPAPIAHTPGPAPDLSQKCTTEQLLEDALFHNPDSWYDNTDSERASINGGNGPDFRHKDIKDASGHNLGAWMKGKFSIAPDWAWDKVGRLDDYKELAAAGKLN